jgi:hypothetical protein
MRRRGSPGAGIWLYLAGVIVPAGGLLVALMLLFGRAAGHVAGWSERALPEAAPATSATSAPSLAQSTAGNASGTSRAALTATPTDALSTRGIASPVSGAQPATNGAAAGFPGAPSGGSSQAGSATGSAPGGTGSSGTTAIPAQGTGGTGAAVGAAGAGVSGVGVASRTSAGQPVAPVVAGVQVGPLMGRSGAPILPVFPLLSATMLLSLGMFARRAHARR